MFEKLVLLCLFVFITIVILFLNSRAMNTKVYSYLALGDSYTIGEGVTIQESFPYQVTQLMRLAGYNFTAPEMVAATGWTTDALKSAIKKTVFQHSYNFVSLLIGVNDQYQHKDVQTYGTQFGDLLNQAVQFADGKPAQVFVLSIPDWGRTPFAAGKDKDLISREIDIFNGINENIARRHGVNYVKVYEPGRDPSTSGDWLAHDGLHPSARLHTAWAEQVAAGFQKSFA